MNVDDIIRIINAVPEGTNMSINIGTQTETPGPAPGPAPEPDPGPDTVLIEMTNGQAVIKPVGYDDKGKPIMEHTIVGFRAEAGDVYAVVAPAVVASGGSKYFQIWRGANNDTARRGWYVMKENTKKFT